MLPWQLVPAKPAEVRSLYRLEQARRVGLYLLLLEQVRMVVEELYSSSANLKRH
jgi:hypothetical protein